MRALCGEKSFFSPLITANLTLFFDQTSTRDNIVAFMKKYGTLAERGAINMHPLSWRRAQTKKIKINITHPRDYNPHFGMFTMMTEYRLSYH